MVDPALTERIKLVRCQINYSRLRLQISQITQLKENGKLRLNNSYSYHQKFYTQVFSNRRNYGCSRLWLGSSFAVFSDFRWLREGYGLVPNNSLALQVLTSEAYQLLSEARGLATEYQYLRVRIKTEQCRLLDWATVAKLTEREETLLIDRISRTVLVNVFDQQRQLLMQFGRVDSRLKPLSHPLILEEQDEETIDTKVREESRGSNSRHNPQEIDTFDSRFPHSGELLHKCLTFVRRTSKYPAKLRWALVDKGSIEDLVKKLSELNDYLAELLNATQLALLNSRQLRTDYLIVQLNSKLDHLQEIVEAGMSVNRSNTSLRQLHLLESGEFGPPPSSHMKSPNTSHLTSLAQFKALGSAMETNSLTDDFAQKLELGKTAEEITSVELSPGDITWYRHQDSIGANQQRVEAQYKSKRVWIEWKSGDSGNSYERKDENNGKVIRRLNALVALLRENTRTEQFSAAPCLGYFRFEVENEEVRLGLVFEPPAGVDPEATPMSLFQLLRDGTKPIPSLTARVALARALTECLERLHAVNWLHKGLRSDNVLFFPTENEDCDLSKPYLSGFDYSRPAQRRDMTERPSENIAHDLYRHPQVQTMAFEAPNSKGYKKRHDIYSLGVVLLEILYWQTIDSILGFEDFKKIRPSVVATLRGELLNGAYLGYVHSHMGDTIHEVVRSCLQGMTAFGISEDSDEMDVFVGAKLQGMFFTLVSQKLQGIKI
jgi:hypothetical protein